MTALSPVEALYREVVLEHYRHPRSRTPLEAPDASARVDNPVCGDQVHVEICLEDARIHDVSARTRGCSIAVAAASVMTELVRGLGGSEIASLARELERLVGGESVADPLDERLRAFARLADLPSRRRCALLPWEALESAIRQAGGE